MSDETPSQKIQRLVARLTELLEPIMYPPRSAHPVIAPYATMDTCGHVYLVADGCSFVNDGAELNDLMNMNSERIQEIVARRPHRAAEKVPGCAHCGVERTIRQRTEPLHWRLN